MSEFRAALQNLYDAINDPDVDYYNTLPLQVAIESAKALLARPEAEPTNIVFDNPSYEPWLASQGLRPEPEPRITREEAMRLLDNLQTAYARMMYQKAHLGEQYDDAREACLAAMLRSEPDDICCLGFKDANECRCHREEQASSEIAREWQPIESAPTQGKWVLLWWPAVTAAPFAGYCVDRVWHAATNLPGDTWTRGPTHWQRLPSPPAASDGEKS